VRELAAVSGMRPLSVCSAASFGPRTGVNEPFSLECKHHECLTQFLTFVAGIGCF